MLWFDLADIVGKSLGSMLRFLCFAVLLCWEVLTSQTQDHQTQAQSHQDHQTQAQQCSLIPGSMSMPVLQRPGNITLGGLFSLHDAVLETDLSFTTLPAAMRCTGSDLHPPGLGLLQGRQQLRETL